MSGPTPTLHARLLEVAARHPKAVAVVDDASTLRYGELVARAREVAAALRERGLGPGSLVPVLLPRSTELVAALVGVLMAGAAYVPLDVEHPEARLRALLEDCGATVVLGHGDARTHALGPAVIDPRGLPRGGEHEIHAGSGADAAYVIYTSGSTGRPKGVVVEHRHVLALLRGAAERFDLAAHGVWSMTHSPAFDFSVWEMWGALLHGARLVVVAAEHARDPRALRERLRRERVSMLSQTPSAFQLLLEADARDPVPLDALRTVVFGGERLDVRRLRPWLLRHGDERPALVNMYGITETTVHVSYRRIRMHDLDRTDSPIGEPLPHLRIHLVDDRLRPVPEGEVGEIAVGGEGVARGYLGRPELDEARFVPDPWGTGRLYRSGDLARRVSDGYAYLGRADRQVKLRGHRIECGEIEACMERLPAVERAVVLLEEHEHGPALCAYVRPAAGDPGVAELRAHAERALPGYMVPARWCLVDEIPLTLNGKLDEAALRRGARPALAPAGEAPAAGSVVALVLELYRDRLGLPAHDPDGDFFALGGHSLLLVELVAALEQRFAVIVPFGELVAAVTPREQAALVERLRAAP